jgi:hypothetical protein
MKIEHNINKLSKVSFSSRPQLDARGEPLDIMVESWEEISHTTAKALDELQNRINDLEAKVDAVLGGDKIIDLMEKLSKMKDTSDKPPKEPVPLGVPLSRIKNKGGRPKKVEP